MRKLQGQTMGSFWTVNIAAIVTDDQAERIKGAINLVLEMINQKMSTFIDGSEVSKFAAYKDETPFKLTPETHEVVKKALQICKQTDGVYDITVAPLVDIWGFGPDKVECSPNEEDIWQAKQLVDYKRLRLSDEGLLKTDPKTRIDLSSIAKGYAVDKLAELMVNFGYHNYLVEIGGESRVSGHKYDTPWLIGIERPQWGGGVYEYMLTFKDVKLAIATSGNYKNYTQYNAEIMSHEINVQKGRSQMSALLSVTVFADDCMSADGYATALFLLGEDAFRFSEKENIPALFLHPDKHNPSKCRVKLNAPLSHYLENRIYI